MNTASSSTRAGGETSAAEIWVRAMVADGYRFLLRAGADPHDLSAYHIRKDYIPGVVTEDDSDMLLEALADRGFTPPAAPCVGRVAA